MAAAALIKTSLPHAKCREQCTEWHRKELFLFFFLMRKKNFPIDSPENFLLYLNMHNKMRNAVFLRSRYLILINQDSLSKEEGGKIPIMVATIVSARAQADDGGP